jgi:hypothetical protein
VGYTGLVVAELFLLVVLYVVVLFLIAETSMTMH